MATFQDLKYETLVLYLECPHVQATFFYCCTVCSFFNLCLFNNGLKVREHARKLLEKHIKKPFFDAR